MNLRRIMQLSHGIFEILETHEKDLQKSIMKPIHREVLHFLDPLLAMR